MLQRKTFGWYSLVLTSALTVLIGGMIAWRFHLQTLDGLIRDKKRAMKKLSISGGIIPSQEVADYLHQRQASIDARYQHWLKQIVVVPDAEASVTDSQLYFRERFHEMERSLEKTAAAREVPVPERLGFPKELPPSDTVPRLLVQLSMIQEMGSILIGRDLAQVVSFKVEDPEPVPLADTDVVLMRLPVRIRLSATLPQLMQVIEAFEQTRPLVDLRLLRIMAEPSEQPEKTSDKLALLQVELIASRYLLASTPTTSPAEDKQPARKRAGT